METVPPFRKKVLSPLLLGVLQSCSDYMTVFGRGRLFPPPPGKAVSRRGPFFSEIVDSPPVGDVGVIRGPEPPFSPPVTASSWVTRCDAEEQVFLRLE